MRIEFPTHVTVEPAIVDRYARLPEPSMISRTVDGVQVYEVRTDTAGLLASAARYADRGAGAIYGMSGVQRGQWTGTPSHAHAVTLAHLGWSEPLDDVLAQARRVAVERMVSLIPRIEHCDEPADLGLDVERYLDGDDECWLRSTHSDRERTGRGMVHLVMEPCVSAGMSEESILQRGAIVAALCWALERVGARVSIDYRSLISDAAGNDVHVYAAIKPWGQRLNLRAAIFWLAHPSASRRVVFSQVYRVAGFESSVGWASAYHSRLALPRGTVEIPALHLRDMPTVEQWIHKVCTTAGVSFGGKL